MKTKRYRSSAYFRGSGVEDVQKRAEARRERNKQATREYLERERDAFMRAGLTSKGKRFTNYNSWKGARARAANRGPSWRWRVDALDREYPAFFDRLDEETSLPALEAKERARKRSNVARNILHQRRLVQYRNEDIISGDVEVRNYAQFTGLMARYRRGSPHQDSDLTAALRRRYPEWYQKYLKLRKLRKEKIRPRK